MGTLSTEEQQKGQFVRDVDDIVVAEHPDLEFALEGKIGPVTPAPTYETGGTWSSMGSFVSLYFQGASVTLTALHAVEPLAPGEGLEVRMAREQRDGRRMDNQSVERSPRVVADLVIAFLVRGSILPV